MDIINNKLKTNMNDSLNSENEHEEIYIEITELENTTTPASRRGISSAPFS